MNFRLACGHTITVLPWECWLLVIRKPCSACLRAAIEARA